MAKSKAAFYHQISAGRAHTLANTDDGVMFAFGEGTYGQLGNAHQYQGKSLSDMALPTVVDLTSGDGQGY